MFGSTIRVCIVGMFLSSFTPASYAHTVEPSLHISKGDFANPQVALTLDLCMGEIDHRIFDVLLSHNIKATLFVTARWLRRNKETVAVIRSHPELFEVANHGANHIPAIDNETTIYGLKTAGSLKAVCDEIKGGEEALVATGFPRSYWYRDAAARYSKNAEQLIADMGYRIGGFSLNADMGASLPANTVRSRIVNAKNGDVIIAHMNQPKRASGQGVADGIMALKARGFTFVKLSDAVQSNNEQEKLTDCNAL